MTLGFADDIEVVSPLPDGGYGFILSVQGSGEPLGRQGRAVTRRMRRGLS